MSGDRLFTGTGVNLEMSRASLEGVAGSATGRVKRPLVCSGLFKPSDGLEPSTPSLHEREEGPTHAGLRVVVPDPACR